MRFAVACALISIPIAARAQGVDRRYVDEPTDGLALPLTPLAGEHDARATVVNPGGLALLRGPELALALDLEDTAVATSSGPGFGAYIGLPIGGRWVPKFALGLGFEWLAPPRAQLAPDPGKPFRFTFGYAQALGDAVGLGLSWHHFSEDGALSGRDTFDLGLSSRWNNFFALGATLRDIATAPIAGLDIQRRYQLEADVRPLATDALEVAIGAGIGETRHDFTGWGRVAARAARGFYVLGGVESRDVRALVDSPAGTTIADGHELRATIGLQISLGALGVGGYGTGLRNDLGARHPLGGTMLATVSAVPAPSALGTADHIERVELSGEVSARQLVAHVVRLRAIARDPSVKGVVVVLDGVDLGWAGLEELHDELVRVRHAGKKVFAYMVWGTGRDYLIACAADKIYVDPAGGLRLVGMAATTMYFRGAFDLVGVLPQYEKIAEYKSAPEQLTDTGPSPTAARMHTEMYDSLWQRWVGAVIDGRKLTPERVQAIVDGGPYTAGDLGKDHDLVDAVAAPEKVSQLVTAELGRGYPVATAPVSRPERWERPGIAVIYVEGDITDGESKSIPVVGQNLVGGQTLVAAITAARADPRVAAIVVRIDSPGGSALASELVSREVFQTRGIKPIVCSMSNLAASGGYFIAAGCDQIFAEPMTITGSIGIFYGKFDLSGLARKLGITTDTYKHGKHSDVESRFRPYTDEERTVLMDKLRYMYGRFVGAVSEGRKLSKDDVDKAGRGHVYTGEQALTVHLVDKFGGLGDAIAEAKRRVGLDDEAKVQIFELPKPPASLLGIVGGLLGAEAREPSLFDLPIVRELVRDIPASLLASPDSAQARLPFQLVF